MEVVKKKISDLKLDGDNARNHNHRNINSIKESLLAFAQYAPVVVQESSNMVIAGNGTCMAAKELGWNEIDCIVVDVSDEKARAISIVDNRSTELSNWDTTALLKVLTHLDVQNLAIAGYTEKEVERLMESLNFDQKTQDTFDKIKEAKEYTCPKCGKTFAKK